MSVSTNGQICYGVIIEEDSDLPWKDRDDIEEWWTYDVLGFKHSFELFDQKGEWIDGKEAEREVVNKYFQEKRDFEEKNAKCPYELVNYCSCDYPMYILAIKRTCTHARRGYPTRFFPAEIEIVSQEEDRDLELFCKKYSIETSGDTGWFLSSLWC